MKHKYLVLINEIFPFGLDEPFLESEVKYYKGFEKTLIYPCSVTDINSEKRATDSNVVIIGHKNLLNRYGMLRNLYGFIMLIFNPAAIKELISLGKSNKLKLSTVKALLSFIANAEYNLHHIKKELKGQKIAKLDNIIFYSYWMHFHSYIAIKLKKCYPNSKAVTRCHRFDLYEYIHEMDYIPMRPWILRNIDAVFCISADGRNYISNKYGSRVGRGMGSGGGNGEGSGSDSGAGSGSGMPDVKVSRLGTADHGERLVSKSSPFRIVSCSWLLPVKRINRIIDVLSDMSEYEIYWTHIGGGELYEEIKAYAVEKLHGKIDFDLKGSISNSDILGLYKTETFHLFLNVSESEGIPVSIMEAMSFGIPVIATDVGGVNEIVLDSYNGFLLQKDFDNEDLKRKIINVMKMSSEDYQQLRRNSREHWSKNYDREKNYRDFIEMFKAIE